MAESVVGSDLGASHGGCNQTRCHETADKDLFTHWAAEFPDELNGHDCICEVHGGVDSYFSLTLGFALNSFPVIPKGQWGMTIPEVTYETIIRYLKSQHLNSGTYSHCNRKGRHHANRIINQPAEKRTWITIRTQRVVTHHTLILSRSRERLKDIRIRPSEATNKTSTTKRHFKASVRSESGMKPVRWPHPLAAAAAATRYPESDSTYILIKGQFPI